MSARDVQLRFDENVRHRILVTPFYSPEALPSLLLGYNLLLFPSLTEGFPLAPLEAMACSSAVIVSDVPGIAERLQDDENALLIPPRDQQAIENAVQSLIDNPDKFYNLRIAAHKFAQNYSWKRIAVDTISLYQAALQRRNNV